MASKELSEELKAFAKEKKKYCRSYVCKVPPSLRSLNEDAYDPRVVGLGLYHHHQSSLLPQRKFKLEAVLRNLQRMSDRHGSLEQKLAVMQKAAEDRREEIMAYYHDDLEFDASKLILDACFVIEVSMVKGRRAKDILERLIETSAFTDSVLCDIFKLENQVPLFFLKLIISLQDNIHCNDMVSILIWACRRVFVLPEEKEDLLRREGIKMLEISGDDSPAHLLECLRRLIISQISQDSPLTNPDSVARNNYESLSVKIDVESSKTKSSSILRQGNQGNSGYTCSLVNKKLKPTMRSVARAQNLARVGIVFKAGTPPRFEERLFKIKGILYLPALYTNTDTETLLRNVIAFEECYLIPGNLVSLFIFLMGCLIDKEEDVALLRNEGLIDNSMDTEQATADMFNGLTKNITIRNFTSCSDEIREKLKDYCEIWEKLQKYYASSWRAMAKEFIDNHFSKPWLFCATVAAVLVLTLTVVQSYYTIKPCQG